MLVSLPIGPASWLDATGDISYAPHWTFSNNVWALARTLDDISAIVASLEDVALVASHAQLAQTVQRMLSTPGASYSVQSLLHILPRVRSEACQREMLAALMSRDEWTDARFLELLRTSVQHDAPLRRFFVQHWRLGGCSFAFSSSRDIFLYAASLSFSSCLLLREDIMSHVALDASDPIFDESAAQYVATIALISSILFLCDQTRDSRKSAVLDNFSTALQRPWVAREKYSDAARNAAMQAICEAYGRGICISLPRELDSELIAFQRSQVAGQQRTVSVAVVDLLQRAVDDKSSDAGVAIEALSRALTALRLDALGDSSCRALSLSSPVMVNMLLMAKHRHLASWFFAGPSAPALGFALRIAECYRALIAPNIYVVPEDLDGSLMENEWSQVPTVFGILGLASKPCAPEILTARFRVYFSRPLVDAVADSLEPVLLMLEILVDRFYGDMSNVCSILNESCKAFHIIFRKQVSELIVESLPGVFYFVSTQLWDNYGLLNRDTWTLRELCMLAMVFEVLKSDLHVRIDESLAFLQSKRHPYECDMQYTVHIARTLLSCTKDRASLHRVGQALSRWAPMAILEYMSENEGISSQLQMTPNDNTPSDERSPACSGGFQPNPEAFSANPASALTLSHRMATLIASLSHCSTFQALCLLTIAECYACTIDGIHSDEENLAVRYTAQECLEMLDMRSSASISKSAGVSFSHAWAKELWSRLSSVMQSFLMPLLKSRYSCVSQISGQDCRQDIYSESTPNAALRKLVMSIRLPRSLSQKIEALLMLSDFEIRKLSPKFDDMSDDNVRCFFESILLVAPIVHAHRDALSGCSMQQIVNIVDVSGVCRRLQLSGQYWLAIRVAEESLLYQKGGDTPGLMAVIAGSMRKLGLWAAASGYRTSRDGEPLADLLGDELADRAIPSIAAYNAPHLNRIFSFADMERLQARYDTRSIGTLDSFAALQSWGVLGDAYATPSDVISDHWPIICNPLSSVLSAVKTRMQSESQAPESVIMECVSLNALLEGHAGKWSSLSKVSQTLTIQALQTLSFGAKVSERLLGDTTTLSRSISLLMVNKLRSLGRNGMALSTLMESSASADWAGHYYAAKILASEGQPDTAVQLLESALENCASEYDSKVATTLARVMHNSKAYSEARVRAAFDRAISINRSCLKTQFQFAAYLDDISPESSAERQLDVLKAYVRTFSLGDKYDRVACCRFFSCWFAVTDHPEYDPKRKDSWNKINDLAMRVARKSSVYKFLPNLTQIAAKICQCDQATLSVLQTIIIRLLQEFPHTTIWKIANYVLSNVHARREKYGFLTLTVQSDPGLAHIWNEYFKLLPMFADLTALGKTRENFALISQTFPKLQQISLSSIAAPTSWTIYRNQRVQREPVFFSALEDRIDILPSLQKPKRIAVRCSDGVRRLFLFKPKDDLRKDMRFLELAALVNTMLSQFGQIRIYAALPLNEDAGIIEWVDRTCSMRSVLLKFYRELNIPINYPEFQEMQKAAGFARVFVTSILPKFPPVLPRWFMRNFQGTQPWFSARQAFIRTTSTISMFGHVMGLGDRHCENVMLCEDSGQCMHVDFNCLFDKGKSLHVPERVPFRLTQNITATFGACGYRGEFHSQCVGVLKSLRANCQMIMANLEPMVNDPTSDMTRDKQDVRTVMQLIRNRLEGLEDGSIFRSEIGQVSHLIEQATNAENLSLMYVGWAPFL